MDHTDAEEIVAPLRVGAVSYLNTAPLVRALPELAPGARLSLDHPSGLADKLADGRLEVALAPSIELARHPEWSIISTACIGCRGPVLSVKVLFRKPPGEIESLALDEGSRTSVALAQILLNDACGVRPRLEVLPLGARPSDADADAVLVIGDRAIAPAPPEFCEAWDLGERWRRETGLPFVFAVWAARPGVDLGELEPALDAARDRGVAELETIATERAAAMGLARSVVLKYLREHLNFYFDVGERRGLELFLRRSAGLDLIPHEFRWQFDDSAAEHQ
jgi:chorismate dehydratase